MIDTKYYKLLKNYPNHSIGDLAIIDRNCSELNFIWFKTSMDIPSDFQPDMNPDWFELCLFVTEDGVPIFKNDSYWYMTDGVIFENYLAVGNRRNYSDKAETKRFSTKESAEAYLNPAIKFDTYLCRPQCGTILSLSIRTNAESSQFKNVTSLGNSKNYGQVYKCWDENESDYILFFGTKP